MKLKNRNGSTLVLTLMIFAVLMIFATFTLGFMVTENKQSMYHQNKTQAYYIARSGAEAVEAAIMSMNEEELSNINTKLDMEEMLLPELNIGNDKCLVSMKKVENDLMLTSESIVSNISNSVTKVLVGEEVSNNIKIDFAIFSSNDINLENNAEIWGDIGTNKSINFGNNAIITGGGKIYLIKGNKINTNKYDSKIVERDNLIEYDLFKFPDIPENNSTNDFIINKNTVKTINKANNYNNLIVENKGILIIDANISDVILNVKYLDLKNNSQILIKGNKNVVIYVENMNISNNSTVERIVGNGLLNIYQYGNSAVTLKNNFKGNMNLYIKKSKLSLENNLEGIINIFSNGETIEVKNNDVLKGLIYAPKSKITLRNNVEIKGAIIGDKVDIFNNAIVKFDSRYIDNSPKFPSNSIKYKSSYFK